MIVITKKNLRKEFLAGFFMPIAVAGTLLLLYVSMQATSIYGGDSGELVSAAYTWGIAHPPGYPLYTLLGALLSHIVTVGTVAWRMGFLSSIPMALSAYFVWHIVFRLTKNSVAATASSLLYGLLYPVWLYAITPEVFAMYAMFSALIVLLFLKWMDTKDSMTISLLALVSGIAFTHHHLILLTISAAGVTVFRNFKEHVTHLRHHFARYIALFILGFSFYAYAPIASLGLPPFDREHASSIEGFIRLVTRASYGSFRASVTTGGIFNGLTDVATFGQYLFQDMTFIGVTLAIAGLYWLWRKERRVFDFFAASLVFSLFYFFYAGFPMVNNFLIGTLERFFIVPYQTIAILVGVGIAFIYTKIAAHARRSVAILFSALVLLLPLYSFRAQYTKLATLTHDRTLERFADDVLVGVPQGALFGVYSDTMGSSIDYAHYVQQKRPDIIYLNYYMLGMKHYRESLQKRNQTLVMPEWKNDMTTAQYITVFLKENAISRAITSNVVLTNTPGVFIPSGLVYVYYPRVEDVPAQSLILEKNTWLWSQFSDPLAGALGKYKHLMLSDVLRIYADQEVALAYIFALSGNYADAQKYLVLALSHETHVRVEKYAPIVTLLLDRKECTVGRAVADKLYAKWKDDFVIVEMYHKIIATCDQRDAEIMRMDERYRELKPAYDTNIE